jgi:hypothetical protein
MSLNDKLAEVFRSRPLEWIDGRELSTIAGCYGWRSRCADLRKRGMCIENQQRRFVTADGSVYVDSRYRYVPERLFEMTEKGREAHL